MDARTRRKQALHGPWSEGTELSRLRERHPGWRFWTALAPDHSTAEWCALRQDGSGEVVGAQTAEELSQRLADIAGTER